MLWLARWRRKDLMQISAQKCECGIRRGVTFTSSADLFAFSLEKCQNSFFFFWQSWWKCHPGMFSFMIFITEYIKSSSILFFLWYSKTAAFGKLCTRRPQRSSATDQVRFLPQSPSRRLKRVWSSLESEWIFSRFHPDCLCIWFWARRGGLGVGAAGCAGTAGGARLPQRYSLLHWDSRWIQSRCQAWVGGLSP